MMALLPTHPYTHTPKQSWKIVKDTLPNRKWEPLAFKIYTNKPRFKSLLTQFLTLNLEYWWEVYSNMKCLLHISKMAANNSNLSSLFMSRIRQRNVAETQVIVWLYHTNLLSVSSHGSKSFINNRLCLLMCLCNHGNLFKMMQVFDGVQTADQMKCLWYEINNGNIL